ncbi:hypothetical protein NHF46_10060 [Arthrobacter alpinus]|nr:hypothetical protein [Arthrobacter alpinus]
MLKFVGLIKFIFSKIWPQFDNWILIVLSVVFAIGGITGMASGLLNPIMVAMLGILAISQLRIRSQVSAVAENWQSSRTDIFLSRFPQEYLEAQKNVTQNYFFTGITMSRTLPMMGQGITRILENNGQVRILLPDPNNDNLLKMIAEIRPGKNVRDIRLDIEHSLRTAKLLSSGAGRLEIRTIQFLPSIGINAMDLGHPMRSIMIQMYEFHPASGDERAPIFYLTAVDHAWFGHFEAQVERLWAKGSVY